MVTCLAATAYMYA